MNALAIQKSLDTARTPDAGKKANWPTRADLALSDARNVDSVPPKVEQAISEMRGQVRSTFLVLQLLVVLIMGGNALLNTQLMLLDRSAWLPIIGLLVIFGGLLFLPLRLIASDWFPGLLALLDTIITAALFYYSGMAGVAGYTTYLVIMMIALLTRTRKHVYLYSGVVTSMYGLAFYQDGGRAFFTFDSHLLQLPVTLAMAVACGRAMESLKVLATCDPLTGLPSRHQFGHLVRRAVKQAGKSKEQLGVLFLDIVGLDEVVNTQGHLASDRIMKSIVSRLIPLVKSGDIVARHGHASLSILTRNYDTPAEVANLAHDCVDMIRTPFITSGETVRLSAHVGGELVPDARHGTVTTMLHNAKTALARAKTRGANCYEFYSQEMESRSFDPLFLEISLRKALNRKELSVSYQPKVNLCNRATDGHRSTDALAPP